MTEKRFVNENDGDIRDTSTMRLYYCLSLTGKHLCDLLNEQDERIKELEKENKQLIKELFESEEEYLLATYYDNPIRRDDKIQELKHEFKERFGDVE